MQGSPRNTGAYKSGAAEVDDEMRARAFEPSSRPDLLGGLLEARLGPKRPAQQPRTAHRAVWRTTAKTAARSLQNGTKRSPGTQ